MFLFLVHVFLALASFLVSFAFTAFFAVDFYLTFHQQVLFCWSTPYKSLCFHDFINTLTWMKNWSCNPFPCVFCSSGCLNLQQIYVVGCILLWDLSCAYLLILSDCLTNCTFIVFAVDFYQAFHQQMLFCQSTLAATSIGPEILGFTADQIGYHSACNCVQWWQGIYQVSQFLQSCF